MFLDWVSSLQLLEHSKDTHILKDFSLPVKRILVSQVVNLFLDPNTSPSILSTNAHVHWVLECVGQGFLLPVEDLTVIAACIELYKRWLLETNPKSRPPPIVADEQHFTRVMLQHLSLIFTPRTTGKETDVHTVLCQRVLSIFLEFGRSSKADKATWEVALKLSLGVSDCLLGSDRPADDPQVKAIAPHLLKVLFELWLHARTTDPDLWASLVRLTNNWVHLMPMAAQWNLTTLGLTNRLLTLLYPNNNNNNNETQHSFVTIKTSEADTINIDLSPEHVFYAWHRMLHVLGNPNKLANPAIFLCTMNGLNTLVCQFLKVGRSVEQREKLDVPRPDGNTILHIFGSWLFEAVKSNRLAFDEGTSIAVEALNHIYNASQYAGPSSSALSPSSSSSSSTTTPLAPVYLASFYQCMAEALASDARVLMSAVQYGQWLLFSELPGARVLVPLYISAISKILPLSVPYHPSVAAPDVIRRCCIKIVGGLICLPNRFGDLPIPTIHNKNIKPADKNLPEIVTYKDIIPHISHLLLSGLSTEKSPHNAELLLWYIPVFLKELIAAEHSSAGTPISPAEFVVGAVDVITASICNSVWNYDVSQAACRVLSSLSRMHSSLPNGADIGLIVTKLLCEFAIGRIGVSSLDEELVAAIIMCITDWVLVDQWLITKRDALEVFIDLCMLGLGAREHEPEPIAPPVTAPAGRNAPASPVPSRKAKLPPGEKLKQAAQHGLLNVLHNLGNFPATTGPSRISSLVSEEDVLQRIKEADPTISDPEEFVRYFIVDESFMLSVIDIPNGAGDPSCVIVVRDRTGKYVWNANKPYLPFTPKKESEIEDNSNELIHNESTDDLTRFTSSPMRAGTPTPGGNGSPNLRPRALVSEGSSGDLKLVAAVEADVSKRNRAETYQELVTYINMHSDDTFLTLAERVRENETSLLGQFKDQTMAVAIATEPPARHNPYVGPCKFQLGRQLLASLGLFSSCHSKVVPLHPGPPLSACIKALDTIAERIQHKVGVIYACKDKTQEDAYANINTSAEYKDFLATLGWPVHVPTHKGYLGGLDPKGQHGTEAPYYSNYTLETVFLVTSLMPNNFTAAEPEKPSTTHKKALLRGIPVVIVWTEDHRYDTTTLTEGVPLQIVVIPQTSGMYRVRVLKTTSISKIQVGPISEDMIVSKQVLGDMVRETAIIASQLIAPVVHPYTTRRSYIEQMSRSFKSPNMPIDAFYGKIFGAMPKSSFTSSTPSGGTSGGPGDKLTLRRGQVGLKFAFTPPPPPSVIPTIASSQEKFNLSSSFDTAPFQSIAHQPSPPSPVPSVPSDSSLTRSSSDSNVTGPLNQGFLSGSAEGIKTDRGDGLSSTPSFAKEASTAPIPIPGMATTPNTTPSKRNSTPVLSSDTPPSEFLPPVSTPPSNMKPPTPSPPTPPLNAVNSPPPTGFVPGKAWKGSRPTAGTRAQSPFAPAAHLDVDGGAAGGAAGSPGQSSPPTHHREGHMSQPPVHRITGLFEIGGRKSNK